VRRKIISALLYLTTAFTFAMYFDSVYGAGPVTRGVWLLKLAMAGMMLFVIACMLSFFSLRVGLVCATAGGLLSWPAFAVAVFRIPWTSIISILPHSNWLDLLIAMVTLVVSSFYSVKQAILLSRGRTSTETRNLGLSVVAAVVYALVVVVVTYWRGIWDWLFRLRYGS
jgi:hypothetical protein